MTDTSKLPTSAEVNALDLATQDVAITEGADEALARAVQLRALVPTNREQELGVEVSDYEFVDVNEARPPRKSFRQTIVDWARDADPRTVDGPKLPLIVISLGSFIGAWDVAAFSILLPDIQAEFGLNV